MTVDEERFAIERERSAQTALSGADAPIAGGAASGQAPRSEAPTSEPPTSETPTSETPTSEPPTSEAPTSEPPTPKAPFADVLCAVDGTRASLAAVSQAAQIAGPRARLMLLAVTSAGSGAPLFRSAAISPQRVGRVLDRAARVAEDEGASFTREIDPDGPPSAVIIKRAVDHDLLAIGAPARSSLGGFGGGVASTTLRSFQTPLLLARPALPGEHVLDRVLIASDGSDSSDELVTLAAKLLAGRGGAVLLLHVLGSESQSQPHRIASQQQTLEESCDGRVTVLAEPGDVCEVLVDVASRQGATLAMLGTRKHAVLGSVLGSVSRRAVHALHCSALLIPPQWRAPAA